MQEEVYQLLDDLNHAVTRPWAVMEVCGGQTHAIASLGLEELLPPELRLIHGPGCPVCVTSVDLIDRAVELSLKPGVAVCSYGDMMRVPGSHGDLLSAKACGGDVRLMYSPLEAVALAGANPGLDVVFLPWVLRLPLRLRRWPCSRRVPWGMPIFPCFAPMFWCLPPWNG